MGGSECHCDPTPYNVRVSVGPLANPDSHPCLQHSLSQCFTLITGIITFDNMGVCYLANNAPASHMCETASILNRDDKAPPPGMNCSATSNLVPRTWSTLNNGRP